MELKNKTLEELQTIYDVRQARIDEIDARILELKLRNIQLKVGNCIDELISNG